MPRSAGDAQSWTVEAGDFRRLMLATRDFDRRLYRELRRELRAAGQPMVRDIRAEIDRIPSSGKYRTGVREALKAGTRVAVTTSTRTPGIRIVTSPNRLPAGKRSLAKALNTRSFRHPVPGGGWAIQQGHPYFNTGIGRNVPMVRDAVVRAFEHAARSLPHTTGV